MRHLCVLDILREGVVERYLIGRPIVNDNLSWVGYVDDDGPVTPFGLGLVVAKIVPHLFREVLPSSRRFREVEDGKMPAWPCHEVLPLLGY